MTGVGLKTPLLVFEQQRAEAGFTVTQHQWSGSCGYMVSNCHVLHFPTRRSIMQVLSGFFYYFKLKVDQSISLDMYFTIGHCLV